MRTLILLLLFAVANFITAQTSDESLVSARRKRDKGNYIESAKIYKTYLDKNPTNREATREYAEMLFFELKNYNQAYPYIKKVISYKEDTLMFVYALAKIELYLGHHNQALSRFKSIQHLIPPEKDNDWMIEDIKHSIQSIEFYTKNKNSIISTYLHVVNLGNHVNSQYAEYVPVVDTKEKFIMFTSRRKNEFNPSRDYEDDMYHEDMYMSKRKGHHFDTAIALPYEYQEIKDVQNSKGHESLVSLSPDGSTLFIFKEGTLWKSILHNGKWTIPVKLEKEIIAKDYANHVTVTADGKNLFFTSEKKDGYGNLDIYKAIKKEDGTWTHAENLGNTINTNGNEQSPYISHDGKTLYFSSDAFPGFGGYDIFKSTFDGSKWSIPENIGLPFNSEADDIFFAPKEDFSEGFLSSNRNGTYGDFDIYRFYFTNTSDFNKQELTVVEATDNGSLPEKQNLKELMSTLTQDKHTENIFYRINDSVIVTNSDTVESLVKKGVVKKIDIEQIKKCDTCIYKATNYYTILNPIIKIDTSIVANTDSAKNTVNTTSVDDIGDKTFIIYFNFNEITTTGNAEKELKAALQFMRENQNRYITIIGHTDTRGSETYNQQLSEKRALGIADYFKNNKMGISKISAIEGRGEAEPMVTCPSEPCDESINAKNRRVEINFVFPKR